MTDDERLQATKYLAQEVSWYLQCIRDAAERYGVPMPKQTLMMRDPEEDMQQLFFSTEALEDFPLAYARMLAMMKEQMGGTP